MLLCAFTERGWCDNGSDVTFLRGAPSSSRLSGDGDKERNCFGLRTDVVDALHGDLRKRVLPRGLEKLRVGVGAEVGGSADATGPGQARVLRGSGFAGCK